MSRSHGLCAHLNGVLIALFAIGIIACIGVLHDGLGRRISRPATRDRLRIAVTLAPFEDAIRGVGGGDVDVVPLFLPETDATEGRRDALDPSALKSADLIVYGGPLVEPDVEAMLANTAGVHAKVVNASRGAMLLRNPEQESRGRVSPTVSPTFWANAENAIAIAETMKAELTASDPGRADAFRERALTYESGIREGDAAMALSLRSCRTRTLIEGGAPRLGYLANRLQLNYYAAQEDDSGNIPNLAGIVALAREQTIPVIFFELGTSSRIADAIANLTDSATLPIDTGYRPADGKGSFSIIAAMRANGDNLMRGLDCQ